MSQAVDYDFKVNDLVAFTEAVHGIKRGWEEGEEGVVLPLSESERLKVNEYVKVMRLRDGHVEIYYKERFVKKGQSSLREPPKTKYDADY